MATALAKVTIAGVLSVSASGLLLLCRDIAEEEARLPPNKERDKEDKLLERAFWSRWGIGFRCTV